MSTLVIYTETLDAAMKWQADMRHTFQIQSAHTAAAFPVMAPLFEDKDVSLSRILTMSSSVSYPFSFPVRGFPSSNASNEVKAIYGDVEGPTNASYITREELQNKSGELLIIPQHQALAARPRLLEFIQTLPEHQGDPAHQRIVFWFE